MFWELEIIGAWLWEETVGGKGVSDYIYEKGDILSVLRIRML